MTTSWYSSRSARQHRARPRPRLCEVYWRSHGCNKLAGHKGVHRCGPACNDRPMPGDRLYGDDAPRRAA